MADPWPDTVTADRQSEPAPRRAADGARLPILAKPAQSAERAAGADGELVYAVGDIHGRYDLLVRLLAAIREDAALRADGRRPILIFLGDHIDRGPETAKVLSALAWLTSRPDLEVHLLKGNHEEVMCAFLEEPGTAQHWLRSGGGATLRSYGVDAPDPDGAIGDFVDARDQLLDRMPASHLRLLQRLELAVEIGDYAFVHAGARPGRPLARQLPRDLLWTHDDFAGRDHRFERILIHGDGWQTEAPLHRANSIGIDTGAYRTGVLTALRLEDHALAFLQVRGED